MKTPRIQAPFLFLLCHLYISVWLLTTWLQYFCCMSRHDIHIIGRKKTRKQWARCQRVSQPHHPKFLITSKQMQCELCGSLGKFNLDPISTEGWGEQVTLGCSCLFSTSVMTLHLKSNLGWVCNFHVCLIQSHFSVKRMLRGLNC